MQTVSVAIPTYNGEKFIAEAIESVINQSVNVNEILIVDDASFDKTETVVKKMATLHNAYKIRFLRTNQNLGYQANWNRCFENCTTKYLIILHQDDILKKDSVQKLSDFLNYNPELALVGGREDFIDSQTNITRERKPGNVIIFQKGEIFEMISTYGTYIPCSSVMFDMEKISDVGYFDTNVLATDELFWPKVLTKYPIAILGSSIIFRRNHTDQAEWNDFKEKPNEIVGAYQHFLALSKLEIRVEYQKKIRKIIKKKTGNNLLSIATSVIRYYQNSKLALWYLGQALRIDSLIPLKNYSFWKAMGIIILNIIGILNPIRKLRKKLLTNRYNFLSGTSIKN